MKVSPCCSRHQPRSKSILSEVEVFELFIALFKGSLLIKKNQEQCYQFQQSYMGCDMDAEKIEKYAARFNGHIIQKMAIIKQKCKQQF